MTYDAEKHLHPILFRPLLHCFYLTRLFDGFLKSDILARLTTVLDLLKFPRLKLSRYALLVDPSLGLWAPALNTSPNEHADNQRRRKHRSPHPAPPSVVDDDRGSASKVPTQQAPKPPDRQDTIPDAAVRYAWSPG